MVNSTLNETAGASHPWATVVPVSKTFQCKAVRSGSFDCSSKEVQEQYKDRLSVRKCVVYDGRQQKVSTSTTVTLKHLASVIEAGQTTTRVLFRIATAPEFSSYMQRAKLDITSSAPNLVPMPGAEFATLSSEVFKAKEAELAKGTSTARELVLEQTLGRNQGVPQMLPRAMPILIEFQGSGLTTLKVRLSFTFVDVPPSDPFLEEKGSVPRIRTVADSFLVSFFVPKMDGLGVRTSYPVWPSLVDDVRSEWEKIAEEKKDAEEDFLTAVRTFNLGTAACDATATSWSTQSKQGPQSGPDAPERRSSSCGTSQKSIHRISSMHWVS